MIWIAKDLDHWTEMEHPEWWADTVTICGKVFKKLTPRMFAALYEHMRSLARKDALTAEDVTRFTALEHTIHTLGQEGEYYAHVTKKA
jgi:hypothetical protein